MGVEPDADYKVGRIELEPADMLVLYTDGVTEAPRRGRPFGQGKFSDLVHLYGMGTPGELVQAIRRAVDSWVGEGELRDDLALLVCQVVPDATISEPEREIVLPNEPARLGEVRAFVSTFLADVRTPVETMQDMLLAVGEAAGNAARHGRRRDGRSEIRIGCRIDGGEVTVVVADDGEGFDPGPLEQEVLPDRFASGGRGLFLMRQLVDHVEIESSGQGTKVVLRTHLQEARERLKETAAAQ
jgi:anti-sigma regulatory factor (Ser/Thr protein kinase)